MIDPTMVEEYLKGNAAHWDTLSSFPNHEYSICVKLLLDTFGGNFNIYAAVDDVVFRSADDGATWVQIFQITNPNGRTISDMAFMPNNPNTLYICTNGLEAGSTYYNPQLWYTTQARTAIGNTNWTHIAFNTNYSPNMRIDVSPAKPNSIWVLSKDKDPISGINYTSVIKINNFGQSIDTLLYSTYGAINKIDKWKMEFAVSDLYPDTFFIGGYNISRVIYDTINGNQYMPRDNFYDMHVDIRSLDGFVDKNGKEHFFVGNDGGISYSDDYGVTWQNLNKSGLNIRQFYGLGGLESNPDVFSAGSIDNGLVFNYNDSLLGVRGDMYDVIINDKLENIVYFTLFVNFRDSLNQLFPGIMPYSAIANTNSFNYFYRPNALTYNIAVEAASEGSRYDLPIERDPNNPNIVYYGYKNIYRLVDNGGGDLAINKHFDLLALDSTLHKCQSIKFAPSDPNTIYIAYAGPYWNTTSGVNKLWKSTDGGSTWTNLTQNAYSEIYGRGITDIAIGANDPNKVWITIGNYGDSLYTEGINKVYYSEDGGLTWRDYSAGLSIFPVNRIKCVLGNNMDELYIATDIGVYYNNNVDTVWKRLGNSSQMPYFLCTDLEINYGAQQLMISTYGNGIWKTNIDIGCGGNLSHNITGDDIWNQSVYFSGDITINSGASLNIETKVFMDENSTITIKKGGKLIIDGGKLTSRCGMWNGIVVEGDPNLPQFPIANQGYLRLKNNAKIENAIVGVHVLSPQQSPTTPYNPHGGGIIRIDNTSFSNNANGIIMEKYKDITPSGFIKHNLSLITNTKFETTANLQDTTIYPNPIAFIQLNDVHKLRIQSCIFKNTFSNNFNNQNHGIGIDAYNSSFSIDNVLSGDTSLFLNLEKGIKALSTSSNTPIKIDKAIFENTPNAIYLNGITNAKITQNTFTQADEVGYGLYLDNCTDYTIEQNAFFAPSNSSLSIAAMVINNSGSNANEVYNNYFHNFPAAMLAQHDNYGGTPMHGLTIKCNDFSNCMQDIAITENSNYTGTTGIGTFQGAKVDNSTLAGNTFSHKGYSIYFGNNPYSDYNNEKGVIISKYYHHDGMVSDLWVPKYYTYSDPTTGSPLSQTQIVPENVTNQPYSKSVSCEDRQINNGGISVIVLYDSLNTAQMQINSAKLILSIYQDGGNTDLSEEVALAYPWETYQYYNELMLASPYLSDETMIEAINNTDLLPTNLLKLILLANPQCSRSDEVMDMLYSRIPAMPQADIDLILNNQGESSPIDELKANVSYYTHERMRYATQIKNNYLTDTINDYTIDSLMLFLEREDYVNAKYQLAFLHYQSGDYGLMNDILNNISNDFELTERESEENAEFISYFAIVQDMAENSLGYEELTVEQQQELQTLATGIYLPSAYARSLLLKYDVNFTYTEPIIFPTITSSRLQEPNTDNSSTESFIKVYPNPAVDYISIDYKLETGSGRIEIVDNIGRIILTKSITDLRGTEVIGLDKLSSGTYKLVFYENNKHIETKQFTKAN